MVNSYDVRVEFYPISFIGFAAGHEKARSDYEDFTYFECDEIRCSGDITRDYALAKIALAAGPILFSAMAKRSRNSYSGEDDEAVGEYQWAVLASAGSDTFHMRRFFTGLKTKVGTLGLLNEELRFSESEQFYKMNAALINLTRSKVSTTFGAGGLHTSEAKRGLIVFLLFKYHFEKSDKLF
ncbi:MAG: hypothetical protein KC478_10065 [Bacteriovoracaceae bacterium]|nr:hypothetical protein [Bacteriovoracaceae bacterium]